MIHYSVFIPCSNLKYREISMSQFHRQVLAGSSLGVNLLAHVLLAQVVDIFCNLEAADQVYQQVSIFGLLNTYSGLSLQFLFTGFMLHQYRSLFSDEILQVCGSETW
ncbi:hypothetical protein GUJ93_ZPchr0011g28087 [Zizania palustris]|uniref:Uncharacterized protein n=1 Tax=Zizania palustris TaxID=103762 RepID=A0A8J5WHK0_ZIZPA|nr:hypothetical protein GUJ93_ZPchr0011g28087 [Zizania palustris]